MKALIYTYQGEEFNGQIEFDPEHDALMPEFFYRVEMEEFAVYLRGKDIRSIITDLPSDALVIGDPTSSDDAPQPSEPPSESSAPTDT